MYSDYICNKCNKNFKNKYLKYYNTKKTTKIIMYCFQCRINYNYLSYNYTCKDTHNNNNNNNNNININNIDNIDNIDNFYSIGIIDYYDKHHCEYCNMEFKDILVCVEHEKYCKNTKRNNKSCLRCYKSGHFSPDCYEINDIIGRKIKD